jgi:DNA-binding transcriptional LysR family regulator
VLSAELKAFYMVARLGSITLAAKKLGLSQPTVTTQIRNLESQYSVELFYRGGRRLSVRCRALCALQRPRRITSSIW